ncbi:MAG: DNA/RNA non-specific endonuclease, partial [Bacteroidales bacterium]|nr:DNA/RNA non-specific endonuclease [Bacteroidales bacterium]
MKKRESRIANNPVHTRPTGMTIFAAILTIAVPLMLSCHPHKQKPTNHTFNIPIAEEVTPESNLEIPVLDQEEPNLQLIEHYAYTVNYQKEWKIPRWVAYQLTADEVVGTAERKKHFIPDPELDIEVSAVNDDYRNNNRDLDRGHM